MESHTNRLTTNSSRKIHAFCLRSFQIWWSIFVIMVRVGVLWLFVIMIEDIFISNNMNKVYFYYYWQFLSFSFTQSVRTFCADRKARLSERNASLLANCRAWVLYPKNQRALRMGAFLTASEADGFWGCGTRSLRSLKQSFASRKFGCSRHNANEFALCSRLHKLSPLSKNHWRRLPKSLMRINEPVNEEIWCGFKK